MKKLIYIGNIGEYKIQYEIISKKSITHLQSTKRHIDFSDIIYIVSLHETRHFL
jgi:hypothetical protein